jgi:hypothetical protein
VVQIALGAVEGPDGLVGVVSIEDGEGWARLDVTPEQSAIVYGLAATQGWTVDPPRSASARLWALLSPSQRSTPLDEIVWSTLRGVSTIEEASQGLRRRKILAATEDVGTSPFGEAILRPGAVAAVVVEYRYRMSGTGIIEEQARVRYPTADGTGDVLITPPQSTPFQGAETIRKGREARSQATTRAGYLLAAGVVAHAKDATHDPGPQVTHLLGVISSNAGYDLITTYERSRDNTILTSLEGYVGDHSAWLDLDLGLGFTARGLARYELTEPTVGPDGWTPWP